MIVMKYGLKPPSHNAELVRSQLLLAHRYRNTLIEIERGRRTAVRGVMENVGDIPRLKAAVMAARFRVQEATKMVKDHKSKNKTRKVPENLRTELDDARIARRDAVAAWRKSKAEARTPDVVRQLDQINDKANELVRSARAHCGVYWGTYLLVEAAMDESIDMPLYDGTEPNDPRFLRWEGEGRVGVQVQGGMATDLIYAQDTRVRLEKVVDKLGRPNSPYRILWLRVDSDGRKPVWARWPMKMHRPLPEGLIKRVCVQVRKIGPREEWTVQFTVDNELSIRPCGYGAVAVNLGWRKVDGGIRLAFATDGQGETSELVVTDRMISSLRKASDLRAVRDIRFNQARDNLREWIAGRQLPVWFQERTKHVHAWRTPGRLASLVTYWRDHRWDGDEEGYTTFERWRYRDHHLWTWECDQREKSKRRRRDLYRVWSARLAERYNVIVVHEHDLSEVAKKPACDEDQGDNEMARSNRHLVAPSELKKALVNAKKTRDGSTVQMPVEPITQTCNVCGQPEPFDTSKQVMHTCSSCGARWDQDHNASINLLTWYSERSGDAKVLGSARKLKVLDEKGKPKESKRDRIARLNKDKKARLETARISNDNHAKP